MYNNVLILGNGFDLDLGLKTRYSDFAASDEWKMCANQKSKLYKYLNKKKDLARWFDLEQELCNYANYKALRFFTYEEDKRYFRDLHQGLQQYLQKQLKENINVKSCASDVLRAVVANGLFGNIYSFNYTDLNIYAEQLGIKINSKCHYIHGCLSNESLILGVDGRRLKSKYDFLRKTMSSYYHSHNLFQDLNAANEVIFFGLSFGDIDFTYFKDFFKSQSNGENLGGSKKKITIITWNEESRRDILLKLHMMDFDLQMLYGQVYFQLITVSEEKDKVYLSELFERLEKYNYNNTLIGSLIN